MKVTIGKEGLKKTHQDEFPEITSCCKCKGVSRIGFVAHECMDEEPSDAELILSLHENEGQGGYWPHDCCTVAVYFCKECLGVTALYNQG